MKKISFLLFSALFSLNSFGQQALGQRPSVKSPDLNAAGFATFNYFNPSAKEVSMTLFSRDMISFAMTPQGGGLWSFTSNKLDPELYLYSFTVDGQRTLDPSNAYVSRDISTLSNYFIVSYERGDRGWLYQANKVPHGRVEKVWYDSPQLGMERRMTVYLPAGYDGKRRFPVLYLLHGHGGDEQAWPELGRAAQIMDNLIALGKAEPMIVVMPNGNPNLPAAPGEWDAGLYTPDGNAFQEIKAVKSFPESFMDIVNYVDANYKTVKKRSGRAVCGLSMGGGHTHDIALRYPLTFDYYGLFSAAPRVNGQFALQGFYNHAVSSTDYQEKAQTLFNSRPALYWIGIGKDDFLYQANKDLRQFLDEKGYKYEYHESLGGHVWANWRIYLTIFAQKLFKK
ncbi:MAG: esterase [Prevotella sp.]|nr:esterase [Prevotella sp.]